MSHFEIHGDENGIVLKAPGYQDMHLTLMSWPNVQWYDDLPYHGYRADYRRVAITLDCWHEMVEPEPEPPTIYGEGVWLH